MLEALRKGSSNIVIKLFLGALALSFVVWGIGDVFRGSKVTHVATVGDSSISYNAYRERLHKEISRIQNMFGSALTSDQIAAMRLQEMVVGNMINRRLIELEVAALGVQAGDNIVLDYIKSQPSFRNEDGVFDKELFQQMLYANHVTEEQFFTMLRQESATEFLTGTLNTSVMSPDILVALLYAYRNETRNIDILNIAPDYVALDAVPEPSNTELIEFHEKHQDEFSVPEYRELSYVTVAPENIMHEIDVSDDTLKTQYENRIDDFREPERRAVDHMLFDTQEAAKEAYSQLEAGEAFIPLAKKLNDAEEDAVHLGELKKEELFAEVKDTVFALDEGAYSTPVKGPFGWYIFKVTSIKPGVLQSFDDVKDDLRDALRREKASEVLYDTVNAIEDELASGETLEEVAKKFELTVKTQDNISKEATSLSGESIKGLPETSNFVELAFSQGVGDVSPLTLFDDNSRYFAVRVDTITPPRVRALDEVRGAAIQKWKVMKQKEAVEAAADKLAESIRKGAVSFDDAALKAKISKQSGVFVPRPNDGVVAGSDLPVTMVEKIFKMDKGNITSAYSKRDGSYVIGRIQAIVPVSKKTEQVGRSVIANELREASENDIYEQYNYYLRQQHPVEINSSLVNQAVQ